MKYRGIFEYEYPTEHKPPVSIDVHLHGDCVKGKIIEWEYRPLEQEPTTKNDLGVDSVARQDVERYIEDFVNEYTSTEELEFINLELDGLKHIPSVTPQEPKTGHWILTDDDYVYCSECEDSYYPRPIDASWYYCPHCGAKMVEPQESEET